MWSKWDKCLCSYLVVGRWDTRSHWLGRELQLWLENVTVESLILIVLLLERNRRCHHLGITILNNHIDLCFISHDEDGHILAREPNATIMAPKMYHEAIRKLGSLNWLEGRNGQTFWTDCVYSKWLPVRLRTELPKLDWGMGLKM